MNQTDTYSVDQLLEQLTLVQFLLKDLEITTVETFPRGSHYYNLLLRKYRLEERKKAILNELLAR